MLQPNPHISESASCAHGGIDYTELKELGIGPDSVLDFSVSCNPFGPPPGVSDALAQAPIDRYPDSESSELKELLAQKLNIAPENIIIGSGSTELIRLLALAYLGPDDTALIPEPAYSEYAAACQLVGAQTIKQQITKDTNFKLDITETAEIIQKHKPKTIFLCNPNNPTGQYLSREEVEHIMSIAQDGLLVLDEAYIAFSPNAWPSQNLIHRGNVAIVRSMTKDYALAGLRLGYALAAEPIISTLKQVRPPWNVSTAAQVAGIAALTAEGYLEECAVRIKEAKGFLAKELESLGLTPLPSQTNFFLVKVGQAREFRRALLKRGILVRDCTSFGLPQYIRLAPRTLPECQKLIATVKEIGVHSHAR